MALSYGLASAVGSWLGCDAVIAAIGMRVILTPVRAPRANVIAER